MDKYHDNNIEDVRLEALFGEALGDVPTAEETSDALRRFKRNRENHSRRWLYYAAAILFLPIIVIAVPVIISHTNTSTTSEPAPVEQVKPASPDNAGPANPGNADTALYFEFDNVPFSEALYEIATCYGLTVDGNIPDTHIHFRCSRQLSAEEVIDALNDLQIVGLRLEGTTIVAGVAG